MNLFRAPCHLEVPSTSSRRASWISAIGRIALLAGLVPSIGLCDAFGEPMEDPLLGLRFQPAQIHFEALSALPCPAVESTEPPYFVFARATVEGTHYWVLNHRTTTGGDGDALAHQEPAFGLVLAQSAQRCEILATPDAMLVASDEPLGSIRAPLLADAAHRYRRAYGGDSALLQALQPLMRDPACIRTDSTLVEAWRLQGLPLPPACGTHPTVVHDPVFGVRVEWDRLPSRDFDVFCDDEPRQARVWARAAVGLSELALVQSIVPIEADVDPPQTARGFEEDQGQLVKRTGARAVQLGSSSGQLSTDYPEIREALLQDLLRDYVRTLQRLYPNPRQLAELISQSPTCQHTDPLAIDVLREMGLSHSCRRDKAPASGTTRPHQRLSGCSHPEYLRIAADSELEIALDVPSRLYWNVLRKGQQWVVLDPDSSGTGFVHKPPATYSFVVSELHGWTWGTDGVRRHEAVFKHPGRYELYFAEDIETEPDNTLHCLIRIEVMNA
jgi:hypothetical protein